MTFLKSYDNQGNFVRNSNHAFAIMLSVQIERNEGIEGVLVCLLSVVPECERPVYDDIH